jgi:inorganic pyrophosphatase
MGVPKPFYRWRPHPWHGLAVGPQVPDVVNAYIEITPADWMKYEVDKETGYLKVDRPQRASSQPPSLYGFVPRTYCGRRIAELAGTERGDGDPLDICVLSERPILRNEILATARVLGGLRMIDHEEADDKIIGVLANDPYYADVVELEHLSPLMVERLRHYFATYKLVPGGQSPVNVDVVYGRAQALQVIQAAIADYTDEFGE